MTHQKLKDFQQACQKLTDILQASGSTQVFTPCLIEQPSSSPFLDQFQVGKRWLRSSPEHEMQSLLWQQSGDIHQLGPAFRKNETSRIHAEEFLMLEWYRTDHAKLQHITDDMLNLCQALLGNVKVLHLDYRNLFLETCNLDVWDMDHAQLNKQLHEVGGRIDCLRADRLDQLLQLVIIPQLPTDVLLAISHYPADDAEYAQLGYHLQREVAMRCEIYYQGVELANGCEEIVCPKQWKARWDIEQSISSELKLPALKLPANLLKLMQRYTDEHGPAQFAGAALGLERLIMLSLGANSLSGLKTPSS